MLPWLIPFTHPEGDTPGLHCAHLNTISVRRVRKSALSSQLYKGGAILKCKAMLRGKVAQLNRCERGFTGVCSCPGVAWQHVFELAADVSAVATLWIEQHLHGFTPFIPCTEFWGCLTLTYLTFDLAYTYDLNVKQWAMFTSKATKLLSRRLAKIELHLVSYRCGTVSEVFSYYPKVRTCQSERLP